ncbi:unnamed protein product [Protopolystoma xenopodis]|uniref:BAHCC1-like Tudor domain-containing protein n=1 Tax=Protopolystoma xenopodis TaxID=117903 RepID=A0A3S5AAK9_9PLAT|nr:unnamed protein product [Protopolystoma xenopodis]
MSATWYTKDQHGFSIFTLLIQLIFCHLLSWLPFVVILADPEDRLESGCVPIDFDDGDHRQVPISRVRRLPDHFSNLCELAQIAPDAGKCGISSSQSGSLHIATTTAFAAIAATTFKNSVDYTSSVAPSAHLLLAPNQTAFRCNDSNLLPPTNLSLSSDSSRLAFTQAAAKGRTRILPLSTNQSTNGISLLSQPGPTRCRQTNVSVVTSKRPVGRPTRSKI